MYMYMTTKLKATVNKICSSFRKSMKEKTKSKQTNKKETKTKRAQRNVYQSFAHYMLAYCLLSDMVQSVLMSIYDNLNAG